MLKKNKPEAVVAQVLDPKDEIPVNSNVFLIVTFEGDMYEYGRELGKGDVNYLREIKNMTKASRREIYQQLTYWSCAIHIDQIPFMKVRTVGYIKEFVMPSKAVTELCTSAFDFINGDYCLYDEYGMLKMDFIEVCRYDKETEKWINLISEDNLKSSTMKVELNSNLIQKIRCHLASPESSPAEARALLQQVANEIALEEGNSERAIENLLDSVQV